MAGLESNNPSDKLAERKADQTQPPSNAQKQVNHERGTTGNANISSMEKPNNGAYAVLPDNVFATAKDGQSGAFADRQANGRLNERPGQNGDKNDSKPSKNTDARLESSDNPEKASSKATKDGQANFNLLRAVPELVAVFASNTHQLSEIIKASREDLERKKYDPKSRSMGIGPEPGAANSAFVDRNKLWRPDPNLPLPENPSKKDMLAVRQLQERREPGQGQTKQDFFGLEAQKAKEKQFEAKSSGLLGNSDLTNTKTADEKRRQESIDFQLANASPEQLREFKQFLDIEKALEHDPKMLQPETLAKMLKTEPSKLTNEQKENYAAVRDLQKTRRAADGAITAHDALRTLYAHEKWRDDSPLFGKDNQGFLHEVVGRRDNARGREQLVGGNLPTASNFELGRALATIDYETANNPNANQKELKAMQDVVHDELSSRLERKVALFQKYAETEEGRYGLVNQGINAWDWNTGKSGGRLAGFGNSDTTTQAARDQLAQAAKACEELRKNKGSNREFIDEWQKQAVVVGQALHLTNYHLDMTAQAAQGRVDRLSRNSEMGMFMAGYGITAVLAPATEGGSVPVGALVVPPLAAAAGRIGPQILEWQTSKAGGEEYSWGKAAKQGLAALVINSPIMPGGILAERLAARGLENVVLHQAENAAVHGLENAAGHALETAVVRELESGAVHELEIVTVRELENAAAHSLESTAGQGLEIAVANGAEKVVLQPLTTRLAEGAVSAIENAPKNATIGFTDGVVGGFGEEMLESGDAKKAAEAAATRGVMGLGIGPVVIPAAQGAAKALGKAIPRTQTTVDNSKLLAALEADAARQAQIAQIEAGIKPPPDFDSTKVHGGRSSGGAAEAPGRSLSAEPSPRDLQEAPPRLLQEPPAQRTAPSDSAAVPATTAGSDAAPSVRVDAGHESSARAGNDSSTSGTFANADAAAIMRNRARGMTPNSEGSPQLKANPTFDELKPAQRARLDTEAARGNYKELAERTLREWTADDVEKAVILSSGQFEHVADRDLFMKVDLETLRAVGDSTQPQAGSTFAMLSKDANGNVISDPQRIASASIIARSGITRNLQIADLQDLAKLSPADVQAFVDLPYPKEVLDEATSTLHRRVLAGGMLDKSPSENRDKIFALVVSKLYRLPPEDQLHLYQLANSQQLQKIANMDSLDTVNKFLQSCKDRARVHGGWDRDFVQKAVHVYGSDLHNLHPEQMKLLFQYDAKQVASLTKLGNKNREAIATLCQALKTVDSKATRDNLFAIMTEFDTAPGQTLKSMLDSDYASQITPDIIQEMKSLYSRDQAILSDAVRAESTLALASEPSLRSLSPQDKVDLIMNLSEDQIGDLARLNPEALPSAVRDALKKKPDVSSSPESGSSPPSPPPAGGGPTRSSSRTFHHNLSRDESSHEVGHIDQYAPGNKPEGSTTGKSGDGTQPEVPSPNPTDLSIVRATNPAEISSPQTNIPKIDPAKLAGFDQSFNKWTDAVAQREALSWKEIKSGFFEDLGAILSGRTKQGLTKKDRLLTQSSS